MYVQVQTKVLKWADKVASTSIRRPEDELFWGESMDEDRMWILSKYWCIRLPKSRVYIDVDAAQMKCTEAIRHIEEALLFDAKPVMVRDRYKTIITCDSREPLELMVFETETGEKAYVNRKQIKAAGIKDINEFEIRIINRRNPVGFFRDGELVACVLPTAVQDEEI